MRKLTPQFRLAVATALLAIVSPALFAQMQSASPVTGVLVNLIVKPDADLTKMAKVMPEEVRDTVRLYLDGKIQQWYARGDGRGVVFILNCATVEDAKSLMESLPLWKGSYVNLDYMALRPLTPLKLLIGDPQQPGPAQSKQ